MNLKWTEYEFSELKLWFDEPNLNLVNWTLNVGELILILVRYNLKVGELVLNSTEQIRFSMNYSLDYKNKLKVETTELVWILIRWTELDLHELNFESKWTNFEIWWNEFELSEINFEIDEYWSELNMNLGHYNMDVGELIFNSSERI